MTAVTNVVGSRTDGDFATRVGATLSATRRRRKIRLRHLADSQLPLSALKAAERGELALSRQLLTRLASRYGVDLGELCGPRRQLRIGPDSISIASMSEQCELGSLNSMLTAYLRLLDRVRPNVGQPTTALRRDDIAQLADHLDAPCTAVISRLGDLLEARGAETQAMLDLYLAGASVVGLKTLHPAEAAAH